MFCGDSYSASPKKITIAPVASLLNSKWTQHTNSEYGYKISYPASLKVITQQSKQNYSTVIYDSTLWSFQSERPGHMTALIPTLNLRGLNFYPGTYLATVRIGVSNDSEAIKNCLVCENGNKLSPIMINNINFQACTILDAGAGSATSGISYRTVHNKQCFAIEQIRTGPNGRSGWVDKTPNDIPDSTLEAYYYLAGKIIKTFIFSK